MAAMLPFVREWQASGEMRDVDHEVFFGLMGTVGLMALHRTEFEEYREGMYDTVRDEMIETVARGLTTDVGAEGDDE